MTETSIAGLIQAPQFEDLDLPFLLDSHGEIWSFRDYRARVYGAAERLVDWGVGPGKIVSWQLPTSFDAIVLAGALAVAGACQNPILPLYRQRELAFILNECKPDFFIAHDFSACKEMGGVGQHKPRLLYAPWGTFAEARSRPFKDQRDEGRARWIFYTSGTTANPKGALHRDASIIAGARALAERYAMTSKDRYGLTFPFAHVGGVQMLIAQLYSGASAVLFERFEGAKTFSSLGDMGVTMVAGGTALAQRALEAQRTAPSRPLFPRLRAVVTGAAPKPHSLHEELKSELGGVGSLSCYGMTEAPMGVLTRVGDPDAAKAVSEGTPILGSSIRIVDADGSDLQPGEIGEIRVKGPQLMLGYVNSALDAAAFDKDGYLRTGDLGSIDEDGNVKVVGRLKDVIIRNGEKISAAEVEEVLSRHPSVAEVAAIGLPAGSVGERCCAVIKLNPYTDGLSLDEIRLFCCEAGLATFKTPERVEFLDDMPRNSSGKVKKADLVALFADGPKVAL